MEEQMARRLVAAEGKKLQQAGLVARTWGNISCRIDENHFVITPSGLDYETMTARDLVLMDIRNGVCCGAHKPSSEKGVHLAAYQIFPEVGYVIHTHQTYATAIGLCGFEQLAMVGVIAFSLATLFQLVTLPVEFNASARAVRSLENSGRMDEAQIRGTKRVLTAAALTYVAALALSLANLLRLFLLVGGRNRRR